MGFSLGAGVSAVTVFFQGILSFFSPCVLPLLPLYVGYLSGGTGERGEDGRIHYQQSKVTLHTLCFVVGVSFAFFLLGLGMTAVGTFFHSGQRIFAQVGGVLVLLFGLYQLGVFGASRVLGQEHRLPFRIDQLAMSPLTALLMGFTFSFAWTPCVGPALTSVLLMAASTGTKLAGFLLIGVYTLGFVLPFLAVGFFTTSLLEVFKRYRNVVRYTVKAGGVLMIVMGLLMVTGRMNEVSSYLSGLSTGLSGQESRTDADVEAGNPNKGEAADTGRPNGGEAAEAGNPDEGRSAGTGSPNTGESAGSAEDSSRQASESSGEEETQTQENSLPRAVDFELQDQFGNTHTLADYEGKTIFLNFWATWCPPCRAEMPDIQKLYEEYDKEGDEALIVLGVAGPGMGREKDEEGIRAFLEENGYTYPVLMDPTGELFYSYGIQAFPTTFMIDREGNVFGYISGQLTMEMMESIISQTMEGKRR